MTTVYETKAKVPDFRRYREQWENALLSLTMFDHGAGDDDTQRSLCRNWIIGVFNGHAAHAFESPDEGFNALEWKRAGETQFDLIYTSSFGVQCSLGRIYEQPNGTWAALVIAGVKDDRYDAMASAEWAVSQLSS